jgi:hypothetical protein
MEPLMRPNSISARRLAFVLSSLGAALLVGGAGCSHSATDEITSAVVTGERPVAMEGAATYFGGRIAVKVTLGRGIGHGLKKRDKVREDYTTSEGRVFAGNPVPPVTLHLILTNTGTVTASVHLIDFNSDLGNFVIDPDTLVLAPGQTAEPTPMVSNLGVSADTIPFTVTLKCEGSQETQTVQVRSVAIPPPAAPAT